MIVYYLLLSRFELDEAFFYLLYLLEFDGEIFLNTHDLLSISSIVSVPAYLL